MGAFRQVARKQGPLPFLGIPFVPPIADLGLVLSCMWLSPPVLFLMLDELGELHCFFQNWSGITAVGIVVLHQHRNHVRPELVRLG